MSNSLAVATVTAALGQVILDAASQDVTDAEVHVSYYRPGSEPAGAEKTRINVFLYGVTPNPAWRNDDLPTRSQNGRVLQHPRAALDLHYLLTFYGDETLFETQRLLGSVVHTIHARPTIPRAKLREVILANASLATSDMEDAAEAVHVTPVGLTLDELSKLWSVLFQTPYALSAAYQASVVILESAETPQPALPVHARLVYAVPFAAPVVETVENATGRNMPILATSTLVLRGRGLRGEITRVRVGIGGEEVDPSEIRTRQVILPLASVPAARRRAGVQGIQVVHKRLLGSPVAPHRGEESNVVPFVLRPTVDPDAGDASKDAIVFTPGAAGPPPILPRIAVTLTPAVGKRQRAVLLLNELNAVGEPEAYSAVSPSRSADAKTVQFDVPGLPAGTYLVRVQVDGAESLPVQDAGGSFLRPRVVVP